jgi:hypothetical protein
LEKLMLKLLPFGGYFAQFDLAGLNQLLLPGYFRQNLIPRVYFWKFLAEPYSSGGFLFYVLVIIDGIAIPPVDSSFMSW